MITLSNGAEIYQYGKPNLFLMAGVHGEERAAVIALYNIIKKHNKRLNNVWILPCLNVKGFQEFNRLCDGANLNGEFKEETEIGFMQEIISILQNHNPKIFVDLHEDTTMDTDYIWSHFSNVQKNLPVDHQVQEFCRRKDIAIFYYPVTDEYKDTSEYFMRKIGCASAYTTETMTERSIKDRINRNEEYAELFIQIAEGYD